VTTAFNFLRPIIQVPIPLVFRNLNASEVLLLRGDVPLTQATCCLLTR
jgi:hypothetical protein